jgi:serine/threonine protein kinase
MVKLHDAYSKLSIECVLQVGIQVTKALRDIHQKGFLHLDVKPDNILSAFEVSPSYVGRLQKMADLDKNVFLIDLGLCQPYLDSKGNHRP